MLLRKTIGNGEIKKKKGPGEKWMIKKKIAKESLKKWEMRNCGTFSFLWDEIVGQDLNKRGRIEKRKKKGG